MTINLHPQAPDVNGVPLHFAIGRRVNDTNPKPHTQTFADFCEMLRGYAIDRPALDGTESKTEYDEFKKSLPYVSAQFDGERDKEHAKSRSLLWLDVDAVDEVSMRVLKRAVKRSRVAFLYHSTTGHKHPLKGADTHSGRFLFPTNRPMMGAAEIEHCQAVLADFLDIPQSKLDTQVNEAARIMFVPAGGAEFDEGEGDFIDVDELMKLETPKKQEKKAPAAKPETTEKRTTSAHHDDMTVADIKHCLDSLGTDESWLSVGMAVHQASGASEDAWELFDEWSARFPGSYDYDNNRKRWDSFKVGKPGAAGAGTLIHLAGVAPHELPSHGGHIAGDGDLADEAPRKLTLPLSFGFEGYNRVSQYLIKGLLPAECTSSIYGPSGSYKSFLAISWACHIATGKSWDGKKVEQGAVLYVVGEGGTGVPRRIKAWALAHNDGENVTNLCCINQPVFVAAPLQVEQLKLAAEHVEQTTGLPVVLVIIDTLARCFGGADENKASDMGAFIAGCDAVKAATKATVLIVHHSGKDETKGARGSSSFRAALDTEFLVKREPGGAKALVLACTKQKDSEEAEARSYDLSERVICTDADGEDVPSLVVSANGRDPIIEDESAEPTLSAGHRAVYEAITALWDISEGVTTWDAVMASMKQNGTWNHRKGREWLGKLERDGLILLDNGEITRPDSEQEYH